MDHTKKSPTILSLCSGYGGLEIGLKRVFGKISILAHVEIEAFAIANLVNKMETGRMVPAPIWTDVKTFNADIFRGHVDIITGGYPCQPFSQAGKRLGEEDPRHLWPYIKSIITVCQPRWVFFENVEGHLTKGIIQVLTDLEKMGYTVEAGIFSAVEVGAPHQRKRVFILGYHDGINGKAQAERWLNDSETRYSSEKMGHSESNNERRLPIASMHRERVEARGSGDRWPSRPGEPQHEWEEPRVVADTENSERRARFISKKDQGIGTSRNNESPGDGSRETQPKLGGTIDGTRDRVDRLRLLGNGVMPQTAEKAFRTLYYKLREGEYYAKN